MLDQDDFRAAAESGSSGLRLRSREGQFPHAKHHVPLDSRSKRQESYLSCLSCPLDTSTALIVFTNCLHCEWQFQTAVQLHYIG